MTNEHAIKLAIEALEAEIARVQIDADLHDGSPFVELGMAQDFRTPRTAAASKCRAACRAAIEQLRAARKPAPRQEALL